MKQHYHILFLTLLVFIFLSSCTNNPEIEEISVKPPITNINPPPIKVKVPPPVQVDIGPKTAAAVLSDYRLGKGDVISIRVFGEPDFNMDTALSKEGKISYPFLGELKISGSSVAQVEKKITWGLKEDYLKNPKVTVTVLEYRQLFVNGEVKTPGGFAFKPGMTVNKAISLAGGFTEKASRNEIFIIRDGDERATEKKVGLYSFIGPGDILIIRDYKNFFVNGEVKSPGRYQYIPNLTVGKAISIAGGLGEYGSSSKIFVIRDKDQTGRKVPVSRKSPVFPGDIIRVEEGVF